MSGASPAYNVEEMTYALQKASAKYLLTVPGSMDVAAAAAKNAGISKENVFLLEGGMDGFTTMKELLEIGKSYGEGGQVEAFKIPEGKTNFDVVACLSFSSGTTGLPKAVRLKYPYKAGLLDSHTYSGWLERLGLRSKMLSRIIGHDRPPEHYCTMSPSRSIYARRSYKSPRRPTYIPHYRSCSCSPPPYSHKRRGLLHTSFFYENDAGCHRGI